MSIPVQISSTFIEGHTDFNELVFLLKEAFSTQNQIVPQRHHHEFLDPITDKETTLLLMPAWQPGQDAGVKIITVNPDNDALGLPSIQGRYIYLDATNGSVKAIVDAKSLTTKRTATASALASSILSKKNASSLLMIGTGALSPNLIRAHASVRSIQNVFIWGRTIEKALLIKERFSNEAFSVNVVENISDVISNVDIVSCATLSENPLVLGSLIRPGQHIDLVGSYKPHMRESDSELMTKSSIFLDQYEGGLKEAGDIIIPIKEGAIGTSDIKADLFELCAEKHSGRVSDEEITVFKSVGHALEDLVGARYYFKKFIHE